MQRKLMLQRIKSTARRSKYIHEDFMGFLPGNTLGITP